jgi:hypothetical protein
MGDIRNARCLFLQVSWNQYGDQRVDPIRRSLTGSITPIMTWILYADHQVDPLCRSLTGTYFANEGSFTEHVYDEHADDYLANLAIDDLLPNDLASVDIDSILRFREDTVELRNAFQRELKLLQEEISRCNNKKHARYIVEDFIKRFEHAKAEYRASISFFRKSELCSIFSVGLPVAASIIALPMLAGGDPYTPVRLGVGALIGAVSALATREMGYKPKSVGSYLVDAERLIRTPNWLLHRKFEEFIND